MSKENQYQSTVIELEAELYRLGEDINRRRKSIRQLEEIYGKKLQVLNQRRQESLIPTSKKQAVRYELSKDKTKLLGYFADGTSYYIHSDELTEPEKEILKDLKRKVKPVKKKKENNEK